MGSIIRGLTRKSPEDTFQDKRLKGGDSDFHDGMRVYVARRKGIERRNVLEN